jgi:hypothetical protein
VEEEEGEEMMAVVLVSTRILVILIQFDQKDTPTT